MRYLQVSRRTLASANYSVPAQANTFFPPTDQNDHIHLGVPTSYYSEGEPRFAEEGNVFVTYISLKRNGHFWFRLDHNPADGYFSFPTGYGVHDLAPTWVAALRALNMVRGLCN